MSQERRRQLVESVKKGLALAHHGAALAVSGEMERAALQADTAFDELVLVLLSLPQDCSCTTAAEQPCVTALWRAFFQSRAALARATCPCGDETPHRCACDGWWCARCLRKRTTAPGGRCPMAVQQVATDGQNT